MLTVHLTLSMALIIKHGRLVRNVSEWIIIFYYFFFHVESIKY